jgi:hypothetical protein
MKVVLDVLLLGILLESLPPPIRSLQTPRNLTLS